MVVVDQNVLPHLHHTIDEGGGNGLVELPVATGHIEGATIAGFEGAHGQELLPTIGLGRQRGIEHGQPQGGGSRVQDGQGNGRLGHHSHSGCSQQKITVASVREWRKRWGLWWVTA
ncbi:hypothetical protein D3C85_882220 [compost metagenome]